MKNAGNSIYGYAHSFFEEDFYLLVYVYTYVQSNSVLKFTQEIGNNRHLDFVDVNETDRDSKYETFECLPNLQTQVG